MTAPSDELIQYILLGALCVAGVIAGIGFGTRFIQTPALKYFVLACVTFIVLSACSTVGLLWLRWIDYDKGIRASIASAERQGYDVQRSMRSDGTLVFRIKNYVVPDGSYMIVANRSPFRPVWSSVLQWSVFCGIAAAAVSLIAQRIARRHVAAVFA